MASLNQPDEDKQNQPGQPVQTGGSGGASSAGGGAAPQSPVAQNAAPQQTAGFVDVGSYLNANQGGSADLGNRVSSNLTNKYNETKSGIDQSAQSTTQQVNQGYVPENTDLIKQVAANPTAAAKDQNQLSAYQAQLNDTYTGPTNWADLGTQQGKVNEATQYGGLTKTPGGLNVLTQEAEGQTGGNQSQGINQLDTLLLGGSPAAMAQAQAAADPYASLNDYINSQNTAIGQQIGQAQTAAQNTSQDALNAFTGANGTLTGLNADINNMAAQKVSNAQAQQAQLKADIANLYGGQAADNSSTTLGTYNGGTTPWYNTTNYTVGNLSPDDLAAMGMTADQWNALQQQMQLAGTTQNMTGHNFGAGSPTSQIDLSQWLQQQDPTAAYTAANVATPEQYQEMAAINQLLGAKTPQGEAINPLNASQAGTAPANTNLFNYLDALNSATQTQQAERQAAQDEANQISSNADAQHNANKGGGFLGKLENAASIINPVTYLDTALQAQGTKNGLNQLKKVI